MKKYVLAVTTSAFILFCGTLTASAQQSPPGSPMMQQPDQQQSHQHDREAAAPGEEDVTCGGMMGRGVMGQGGMMRHGMMGRGMMSPLAMRMIFALIDSDGDGTISLQEWQAAHEKIFKAMDVDKDGTVSFEEMLAFMHGSRRPVPQR
jgi:EF hand domain-containing protein